MKKTLFFVITILCAGALFAQALSSEDSLNLLKKTDASTKRVYRVPGGKVWAYIFGIVPFIFLILLLSKKSS